MKKIEDKLIIKGEGEEQEKEKEDCGIDNTTSCDCCSEKIPSEISSEEQESNEDHHDADNQQILNNPKLLIVIGLVLTIPIVFLELIPHHSIIIDYITLALATPVQFLLGRPFYYRFYRAIKQKRGFTIDTLVVLSTSIAYGYSLISLLAGADLQFFE